MVTFMIPAHLSGLLSADGRLAKPSMTTVSLNPGSWDEVVREIRERFPLLAAHVLTTSGGIAAGFVLAVNDAVVRDGYASLELRGGDEFSIIAAMAGG